MGAELKEAACSGDVEFLVKAIAEGKPAGYFHAYTSNIFHLAALNQQTDFVKEAIQRLPTDTVLSLLLHPHIFRDNYSPLHVAAEEGCLDIIKEILRFFKSSLMLEDKETPPWLARSRKGNPLEVAVRAGHEDCALEILSMDKESFCVWDEHLVLMLVKAVERHWKRFPVEVLNSCPCGTLDLGLNKDVVQLVENSSLNVCELLFEKLTGYTDGPEYIPLLHYWIRDEMFELLNNLKKMIQHFPAVKTRASLEKMMSSVDKDGQNPLHIAALSNYKEVELVREVFKGMKMDLSHLNPLRMKDRDGNTPLHLAFYKRNEHLVLWFLSLDPQSYQIRYANGESSLFLAVQFGLEKVTEYILDTQHLGFNMLCQDDGQTVFHVLSSSTEQIGRLLVEKYWWLINVADNKGRTALDIARESSTTWLVKLLSDPPSSEEQFDWVTPFDGDVCSILTFYKKCQDLQEICLAKMDTPLHHMKLRTYQNYQNFLNIPSIAQLKNSRDSEGAAPLHKAIKREDVRMAKLLLSDNEVERSVKDKDGKTAMDLLSKLCRKNEEWDKMCKQIGVNPYLKAAYIREKTNLGEMRSTLSVVAALLATITFAAGFTIPGGVNSDTGLAVRGENAAFLVFLLADGYAMCTSMLVLFCLIWSMVCDDADKSWILIDTSVVILMHSLYSTLVAFMTGIFTVVAEKSLWAATLIIVMCSLLGISANRTFLDKIIVKLKFSIERNHDDSPRPRTLVRKIAATFKCTTEPNSSINETGSLVIQGGGEDIVDTSQGGEEDIAGAPQRDIAGTPQRDIASTQQVAEELV